MEQGTIEAAGVSSRVLEALGGIVGASAESLRRAGQSLAEGVAMPDEVDPAFARTARGTAIEVDADMPGQASPAPARAEEPADWDEVDQLFRGG